MGVWAHRAPLLVLDDRFTSRRFVFSKADFGPPLFASPTSYSKHNACLNPFTRSPENPFRDGGLQKAAYKLMEKSVALARGELPRWVGKRYADAVTSCLTCLDKEKHGLNRVWKEG